MCRDQANWLAMVQLPKLIPSLHVISDFSPFALLTMEPRGLHRRACEGGLVVAFAICLGVRHVSTSLW